MTHGKQFRKILPISQVVLAAFLGGFGLWQRNQILSRDYLFGTGWNSTARFHMWPWPFKFAVISNLPAFLVSLLLSRPINAVWPHLHEAEQLAPSLLFVLVLWYWIGSWMDRRWNPTEKTPWVLFGVFTAASLMGAFISIGYLGYQPYGAFVWLIGAAASGQMAKQSARQLS